MTMREKFKVVLPVIQAWSEGKTIQLRSVNESHFGSPDWHDFEVDPNGHPAFGSEFYEWRVKPKPREWWLVVTNTRLSVSNNDLASRVFSRRDDAEQFVKGESEFTTRKFEVVHVTEK